MAPDEPGLDDHPLVRHAEFRGPVRDQWRHEQEEPYERHHAADRARVGPEGDQEPEPERQDHDGLREDDPVEPGAVDDALVLQEVLVDVAQRTEGPKGERRPAIGCCRGGFTATISS